MKHPSLPVKRRSAKKGALRTLFVNVARKRHRAATSAPVMPENEGDVPNVGVARALVVILAIHVVAIVGFFVHSKYFESKSDGGKMAAVEQAPHNAFPKIPSDSLRILVEDGQSYTTIAAKYGVDVNELQKLNGGRELRVGDPLELPPRKLVANVPAELEEIRKGNPLASMNTNVITSPVPVAREIPDEQPMVDVKVPKAVLIKSPIISENDEEEPRPHATASNSNSANTTAKASPKTEIAVPKAKPVTESSKSVASSSKSESKKAAANATPPKKTAKNVTVKAGDTLWSIAKANGTTPAALMKANGVKDASKLRTGMELTIPKN